VRSIAAICGLSMVIASSRSEARGHCRSRLECPPWRPSAAGRVPDRNKIGGSMMAPDKMPQDRYVDADELRLHYLDWGNDAAPPMLLLHGFSGHAHTWDTFARAMCDRYHVVALDQRGHGDSDWARDGAYRPDDHARDIRAVHDKLGLRPVVLIGLSMGGRNSIALTAAHPAKAEKLVIVDIGPDIDPRGAARIARMAGEAPEDFGSVDEAVAYLRPHV